MSPMRDAGRRIQATHRGLLRAATAGAGALALGWLLGVAPSPALAAGPRVAVGETAFDAGPIVRGTKIRHGFAIRNTGDEVLEITEVRPSCGCTVAEHDRILAPGKQGTITAIVDTAKFRGPIAKSVWVFTNDPQNPRLQLVVKADVRALVEAEPSYARFVVVRGEPVEPVRIQIWSDSEEDLRVLGVESPFEFLSVEVHEATEGERRSGHAGRQWLLDLSLSRNAPEGAMADWVVVRTNHPRQAQIKIPVSGFVKPVVAVLPSKADFGQKDLTEPLEAILEVKHLGQGPLELGEISTDVQGLSAEVEPEEGGRSFKVKLHLDPGLPRGPFSGTLSIATSSPLEPVVKVEVTGTVL